MAQAEGEYIAVAQTGYDFLAKGWVNDAIEAFQTVLRQEPGALKAKLGLAIAYQRAGQDDQAWQAYSAVLAQDGSNEAALRAMGTLGSYRPDWQTPGIAALDQLLERYPDDAELRGQRAILLGYQQRFEGAIADYDQLLTPDSNGTLPLATLPDDQQLALVVNAAQIYTYSQQTDVALPLFERYLGQGGLLNRPASLAYATALGQQNRAGEAVALLEALPPGEGGEAFDRRLALALAHQANSDPITSLSALQPLLDPLPEDLAQRQAIANALVPIDLAALYLDIAAIDPAAIDPAAINMAATASATTSISPAGLRSALQSLLQDPEPVTFLQFRLAQLQLTQGDMDSARTSLLAYQAATEELDIGTEFLLADLDQRSDNLEASAQRYGSLMALTEGKRQGDALSGLAAIRFEQQRLGEAEGLYRQLLGQRPADYQARRSFAELMLARDKPKAALAQFTQAQQLTPAAQSAAEPSLGQRQRTVRRSFLRRRGFQPRWERY